ncbi:MAG TPA: class I SAM-dependent methyltransferase [Candidatus Cybelea sp.]|nr:class I SAM-dependent methyltransferase [Candidatus Cybelea sp.]
MRPDVIDLSEFYAGALGQVARRMLRRRIRAIWPNLSGQWLLGIGYATPYLRPFRDEAERVIAVMPAAQGVRHWPDEGPGLTMLAEETELPLPDYSVDRVLLMHALENSEQVGPSLREIWRVLAPGGRLLVVVPNRRGLWARFEHTPFGHGRPYTRAQITQLLREHEFSPLQSDAALFLPPFRWRVLLRAAGAFERLGERWGPRFAGAILVEAGKQVYALVPPKRAQRARLVPAIRPQPAARHLRTR